MRDAAVSNFFHFYYSSTYFEVLDFSKNILIDTISHFFFCNVK